MLKPEITTTYARKQPRGRFRKLYIARLGQVEARGWTSVEARTKCEAIAMRALESAGLDSEVVFIGDREAIVIGPGWDGNWGYHFARENGRGTRIHPGVASKSGWCLYGAGREDTIVKAVEHADSIR